MDKKHVMRRLGLLFLPVVTSILFLFAFWNMLPSETRPIFGLLLLGYFLSPLGREVLIPITVIALLELHGTAYIVPDIILIMICILFVDVMSSLFLLWNLDILRHLPKLGRWIAGMEDYGRRKLGRNKRGRINLSLALTAYMASPFYGSHGIASTIIGMLSGMRKTRIWVAIWTGSMIGSLSVAVAAFTVGQRFIIDTFDNAAWKAISVLVGVGIFMALIGRYWSHRKRWDARKGQ